MLGEWGKVNTKDASLRGKSHINSRKTPTGHSKAMIPKGIDMWARISPTVGEVIGSSQLPFPEGSVVKH